MARNDLWILSIKLQPMDGSTLDENGSEFYFVESLIPASCSSEATEVLERLLQEKKLELIEINRCEIYRSDDWHNVEQFEHIERAAQYANLHNEPRFALFISSAAMDFDEDAESDNDGVDWD